MADHPSSDAPQTLRSNERSSLVEPPTTVIDDSDDDAAAAAAAAITSNNKNEEETTSSNLEKTPATTNMEEEDIAPESNLRDPNRRIWIVTTAALPWRTGTAVNPLARALYLTRGRPKHHVALVLPWLSNPNDQKKIYGSESIFATPQEQETWIRQYCIDRIHCEGELVCFAASYCACCCGFVFSWLFGFARN